MKENLIQKLESLEINESNVPETIKNLCEFQDYVQNQAINLSSKYLEDFINKYGVTERYQIKKILIYKFDKSIEIESEENISNITAIFVYKNFPDIIQVKVVEDMCGESVTSLRYLNLETISTIINVVKKLDLKQF